MIFKYTIIIKINQVTSPPSCRRDVVVSPTSRGHKNMNLHLPPNKQSITLIGMAGAGKSFIGRNLAQQLGFEFIDGDDLIIAKYGPLQELLDSQGEQKFGQIETEVILGLGQMEKLVFSPGGSAAYWPQAMNYLQNNSIIIYLYDTYENVIKRVKNLETRGIVGLKDKSFRQLYQERDHLYKKYADFIIDMSEMQTEDKQKKANDVIKQINLKLKNF